MREFKFNEQSAIENIMRVKFVDKNNILNTVYSLAKYNYHVLGLSDDESYDKILKYITKNCDNIFEESVYKDIKKRISTVKKHKFAIIDEVCITKSEMDVIRSLSDIKQEKVAFVILAVSKYYNLLNQRNYNNAFMTNTDICQMARITIPAKDRDTFMQFAYDKGILKRHTWSDSTVKLVTFVSHDEDDAVVLRLNEGDFKDLAYSYMSYLEPHKFRRCIVCKRWIRVNRNKGQVCKLCSNKKEVEKDNLKTVFCIDCGNPFYVDSRNNTKCRCDACQEEETRRIKRKWWQNNKSINSLE